MFASLVSNKGSNYLVPKKYGDVMLIFLIFIVDSTINLYNKLCYKYEKKKHHVTIFQKYLIIFPIKVKNQLFSLLGKTYKRNFVPLKSTLSRKFFQLDWCSSKKNLHFYEDLCISTRTPFVGDLRNAKDIVFVIIIFSIIYDK